jgi:hypothetical protein
MSGTGKTQVLGTTLTLSTIGMKQLDRLLRNYGNVSWEGGNFYQGGSHPTPRSTSTP